ncbi:MAG TPA: hypothetical protein VF826_06910 [Chloroflexia bacterium]
MIQIDLAAFVQDTRSHMEEIQTMNSYYRPRDHEHKNEARYQKAPALHATPVAYSGYGGQAAEHEAHAGHAAHSGHSEHHGGDQAQEAGEEQPGEGAPFSEKDLDLYRVLVAVERGELSAQDAARKLEELEDAPAGEDNPELI